MKRTARNIISQIPEKDGKFVFDNLPAPLTKPIHELEEEYGKLVARCKERTNNYGLPLARVAEDNNREMINAMKMGYPFISLPEMMALFLSAFKEFDVEVRYLTGRVDQLEAENAKLKERQHVTV